MGAQQLLEYRSRAEERARAALGDSAFGKAVAETANLSILEGLAAAVREKPQPSVAARKPRQGPLTRREFQVAEAIAQGLSNKEIAARLVISQRTAEAHVEHILTKLDFGSRTQVAAWIAGLPEAAT
ncbi:helix-turn-helix transcriptional regulator [Saccharopolyspora indica]